MERYGKGQIREGGCEETYHCLIQTKEKCRFTVPPAVALLNYISSGVLWRIFSPNLNFSRGFLYISVISPFIYLPLPSVSLDFGDFSSNSYLDY